MYTVACACVCTCLFTLGALFSRFSSCFLEDAVDCLTSKPQESSFCASPTVITAVPSHQLLGSGCLNSDPHVCTSYTLWTKTSCQFHVLNELLFNFKWAVEIFLHISRNMPWYCNLYQFSTCFSFVWSHLPILAHSHSELGLSFPCDNHSKIQFPFFPEEDSRLHTKLKKAKEARQIPLINLIRSFIEGLLFIMIIAEYAHA